jgi:hypothetical protein
MQVCPFKIWILLVHNGRTSWTSKKDVVTKFEAMEKILEILDGKVMEVGSSIREVFIVMKMLETHVGQLFGHPMGSERRSSVQSQGP